jgi:pyruvate,water dikinase
VAVTDEGLLASASSAEPRGELVRPLADLRLSDADVAGGKGANLGELIAAGFPVPDGFVVLAGGLRHALAAAGLGGEIARLHTDALAAVREPTTADASDRLSEACARLQETVRRVGVPADLAAAVRAAYSRLGDDVAAAVRSSAVGEDSAETSYAGMNASFTNVRGAAAVIDAVARCWASAFSARAEAYRARRTAQDVPDIAVVVQVMVAAEKAGVAFTADPVTGRRDRVVVEAAWGQGEVVVSGRIEPDTYLLDADGPRLLEAHRGSQTEQIVAAADGGDRTLPVDAAAGEVLTPADAERIAALALRVQSHYGRPQDVEWAVSGEQLMLVQSRPITTLGDGAGPSSAADGPSPPLVRGLAASPGRAAGRVRVLRSPSEGGRLRDGEVLVAPLTNPTGCRPCAAPPHSSPTPAASPATPRSSPASSASPPSSGHGRRPAR